ncbi:DUF72 domain-containing protein [Pendulispora albinea]|uniref:DUF72 domain-containing protein n=1 Tax=Pendulispora albinea TaxID=2741071 RepID=A0ABZ2LTQ0_9BACT
MKDDDDSQGTLFDIPPHDLEPADARLEHEPTARDLPDTIAMGGMTWSFPGWIGIVYAPGTPDKLLAARGLTAYTKHPLLRVVEIDRSYYDPLPSNVFRSFAEQAPDHFRFFAKAHEECVVYRFPEHARYGKKRGASNPRFLDPSYATDAVVGPLVEGLGPKLGGLLFQFPPQDVGDPYGFAAQLHDFLRRLPKGVPYAVELRNAELLTSEYGAALEDTGAVHCHNAWTKMPLIPAQARQIPPGARRPLVIRWLLRQGDKYEEARTRYAPFNRIVSEDPSSRDAIAKLVAKAHRHGVPAFVFVDNKAEGCAPESIGLLGRAIVRELARLRP